MSCIGWSHKTDPRLHDLYCKKLLEPGWAGEVNNAEAAYIAQELKESPTLRRLWQVAQFTRQRKAITPPIAKRLCRWWADRNARGDGVQHSDMVEDFSAPG